MPIEVPFERQQSLAFRWVVKRQPQQKGSPMAESLASELTDAYNNTGSVVKKRERLTKWLKQIELLLILRW